MRLRPGPDRYMTSAPAKRRLDAELVARGLAKTQSSARAMILAGLVSSDGGSLLKPGARVDPSKSIIVDDDEGTWVGRGGLKLSHALEHFKIDPAGAVALDIGASTGGFTNVLLTRGASRVYAVDVGVDQLAKPLRDDSRVVVLDGVNARALSTEDIPQAIDLIVCDASFIGLEVVLPNAMGLAAPGAHLVALIKPQFEVGPDRVGRSGIVRDSDLHTEVCDRIKGWLGAQGWEVLGVTTSPVDGAKGNKEFLIAARRS